MLALTKMSRRANPISLRIYNKRLWSFTYSSPLKKNPKLFHQTSFMDLYLRSKVVQSKLSILKSSKEKQ